MSEVSWQSVKFISHALLGLRELAHRFERASHCVYEEEWPSLQDMAVADDIPIVEIDDSGEIN